MDTISRSELIRSIAETLNISLPEAARRVSFTVEELELEGTEYGPHAAAEIERCIAADVRAGK